jgi:hypothetical protein
MLLELRAENYAVIDQAVASFGPGLNLLTGAAAWGEGFERCGAAWRGEGGAGVRV